MEKVFNENEVQRAHEEAQRDHEMTLSRIELAVEMAKAGRHSEAISIGSALQAMPAAAKQRRR